MVKGKYRNRINHYAVRIAKNSHNNLIGSGSLFLRQPGQSPLLLTAAHVVYPLFDNSDCVSLYMAFSDGNGDVQTMELEVALGNRCSEEIHREGKVYIHPTYLESETARKECRCDAAFMILPWQKWMETCDSFLIKDSLEEDTLKGWGFPESMDGETANEFVDILAGKKEIHGSVNHVEKAAKKFSFSYDLGPMEKGVSRESMMRGFSGSGLFDAEDDGIVFKGLVSSECGGKSAGQMLWASSSVLFLELMKKYQITFQCPDSFEPYMNMIAKGYPKTRKKAKDYFVDLSEELMEDFGLTPGEFENDIQMELQCGSSRNFCNTFWMGELKKAVILYGVNNVPAQELAHACLNMPFPYENDMVRMQFLCTEDQAESAIGEMIEKDYFAKQGKLVDGTVFVLNSKNNSDLHELYSRSECREIICNIAGEYSARKWKRKTGHLLHNEAEEKNFDIIKGRVSPCNLAAVGIEKMMEIIKKRNIDEAAMKQDMEDLLLEIWEI